jgi:hypothetical protein
MAEAPAVERTDPSSESPAGVIYQIPLDSARRDAAPVLPTGRRDSTRGASGNGAGAGGPGSGSGGSSGSSGGAGAGGPGSGSGGSSGSSGGAGAGGNPSGGAGAHGARSSAASATASAGADGGTPQDPSSIHSENGFGSASQVPGVSQAALRTGAGVAATQAAASVMPTYLLIALIAVAAIVMGLLATRHSRRRDA